ncbi:MAG: hypothetical protein Q7R41_00540 [Phycisphaerales bacterium]|nr:hypothetical protein [Phycisphaerales bacterium]
MTSDESPPGLIRTDASGAIDQDLYCLTCGYNLRGLSGDPVRCPECGSPNDLGTAAIPAEMIHRAMRNMETAPTICAGCAFALVVFASPFLMVAYRAYPCILVIAVPSLLGWIPFYFRMKRIYENRPGWRSILRDFHIATFLCAAGVPILWLMVLLSNRLVNPIHGNLWLTAVVTAAAMFMLGLRIYRGAQHRMVTMQRDAAVRIAREILRRQTTHELIWRERKQ